MTNINQIFFQGGSQLGEVESGLVASAFGVPFAIISGRLCAIVAAVLIMLKWPKLRTFKGHEPQPTVYPADKKIRQRFEPLAYFCTLVLVLLFCFHPIMITCVTFITKRYDRK
jgi:hypothetical protein